nr:leiomodin-2-like [Aegilops tauschii subsp. strangulata]
MKTPAHAMMAAVVLVGLLVATGQCRPEAAGRTRAPAPVVSGNKTVAMEEGKLYIKFCIHRECKLDDKLYEECGCCAFLFPYPKCFKTQQECQANCPACHPHCPPESPAPSPPPPPSPSLPPPLPPLPPLPSLPPPPPPTMA